ncbi:hypothetical protein B0T22DRAFT_483143 [Podospora appendiculata]|uniref:Zn(2)-C6 fungal-type domain-containing protein n=1 Tax=Podospora appendiculata TaxID=314037 RepID=A0AAE0X6N1_9PEZI|nr:hypothetical protein B0T22DRAFT_483143 [Podospora appendiculata]
MFDDETYFAVLQELHATDSHSTVPGHPNSIGIAQSEGSTAISWPIPSPQTAASMLSHVDGSFLSGTDSSLDLDWQQQIPGLDSQFDAWSPNYEYDGLSFEFFRGHIESRGVAVADLNPASIDLLPLVSDANHAVAVPSDSTTPCTLTPDSSSQSQSLTPPDLVVGFEVDRTPLIVQGLLAGSGATSTSRHPNGAGRDDIGHSSALAKPPQRTNFSVVSYCGPKVKPRSKPTPGRPKAFHATPSRHIDALAKDENPRVEAKRDSQGQLLGAFRVFSTKEKRRANPSKEARAATALTRQIGACIRCRGMKMKCDISPDDPFKSCVRCSNVSLQVLKQPCVRVSLLDLSLHRKGSTLNNALDAWLLRKQQLAVHSQPDPLARVTCPQRISVTQDFGLQFSVTVAAFVPEPTDVTAWKWNDEAGVEHAMEMPPYYICDMDEMERNMGKAAMQGREEYINGLLHAANPIVRRTFEAAFRYMESTRSTLVSRALSFWVTMRFIEHPWRVCGGDLPPFEPPLDRGCPWSGIIPVTPVMDTQIDDTALKTLIIPLGKSILLDLDRKIRHRRREDWFEIYLTTFIVMNNFDFIFKDVSSYASRHGLKARSSNSAASLSRGYCHACKTVLVYFHFACGGLGPLSPRITPHRLEPASVNGLQFDQQAYIKDTKEELQRQSRLLGKWRTGSVYTNSMYWTLQVVDDEWEDVPHLGPMDDFTEEDFLTS